MAKYLTPISAVTATVQRWIVNKQIHRNVININACLPLKFDSFAAKLTLGLLRKRGQDEFSGIILQNCFEIQYFTKLFSLIIKTMKIIWFSCWPDTKTWTNGMAVVFLGYNWSQMLLFSGPDGSKNWDYTQSLAHAFF